MPLSHQVEPERAAQQTLDFWRVPIGAASPLWAAYAGMAGAGIAYWWMSRLVQPMNLDAYFKGLPTLQTAFTPTLMAETLAALKPEPVAIDEPQTPEEDLAEAAVEAVGDVADAVGEAAVAMSLAADDLTRLAGIGPTLASRLAELGVRTFADIAAWTERDLEEVDKTLDLKGRAVRERWVDQARQFSAQ